jgi:hypothetical protein
MKLKLAIAAALLAATPAFAQPAPPPGGRMAPPPAQQQKVAKPTEAQVQKVVNDIGAAKPKLDSYCKLMKLQQQMSTLDEKKDGQKLQALGQQADAEAQKLGPDFEKVMDGLEQVDENSAEGKKFAAILGGLDGKCPK